MTGAAECDAITQVKSFVWELGPAKDVMRVQCLAAAALLTLAAVASLDGPRPSDRPKHVRGAVAAAFPIHVSWAGNLRVTNQGVGERGAMLRGLRNAAIGARDFSAVRFGELATAPVVAVAVAERPAAIDAVNNRRLSGNRRLRSTPAHTQAGIVSQLRRRGGVCPPVVAGNENRKSVFMVWPVLDFVPASALTKHTQFYHATDINSVKFHWLNAGRKAVA